MQPNPITRLAAGLVRPLYGGIGHILLFHRVCLPNASRLPENAALEVTPEALAEMLTGLRAQGYTFISLDELVERLQSRRPGRKFIAVTFDDGYQDVLTNGLPIFQKLDIPFALYLISGLPDYEVVLWWYLLEDLLNSQQRISLPGENGDIDYLLDKDAERREAVLHIRRLVKFASPAQQAARIQTVFGARFPDLYQKTRDLALSWEQVRILAADPLVTIGAHTHHHYALNRLDEEQARDEMVHCRQRIEAQLGMPVAHFSYPYGSRNEAGAREFRLAAELGFRSAVTTRIANLFLAHGYHLLSLPRLDGAKAHSLAGLEVALSGWTGLRPNRLRRVVTD
ncbi:MAG: polysaccharide deacetylase family protein [Anaerolineae bacterium]|nr:polysaccharide deacetylase family protein [Anaerolineae bacterium]